MSTETGHKPTVTMADVKRKADKITALEQKLYDERAELWVLIRDAHLKGGAPIGDLAKVTGYSRAWVYQVIGPVGSPGRYRGGHKRDGARPSPRG